MPAEALDSAYRLTPIQQGMLFHHLRWPGEGFDVEQIVCRLDEPLSVDAFKDAWTLVASRHEALRTEFVWEGYAEPRQRIAPAVDLSFQELDWRRMTDPERDAALQGFLDADRKHAFALHTAPLFRVTLIHATSERWIAIWTLHHALLDGRSFVLVLRDVFEIYEARLEGRPRPPTPSRPSMRAFVDEMLGRGVADDTYWRNALGGANLPTPVMVGRAISSEHATDDIRGDVSIALAADTSRRLVAAATAANVTLNTFVQAAWAFVLSRYSGQEDVVFGAVRSCRQGERWVDLVGMSINTVPVRVRVDKTALVGDWLATIRQQWVALRDHECASLVDIHHWIDAAPNAALFDTAIVFDTESLHASLTGLDGQWRRRSFELLEQNNYLATLVAYAGPPFVLRLEFDRRRLDRDVAQRMLQHVAVLLEAMALRPDSSVADLPLLTADDQVELLERRNATQRPYQHDTSIHGLIEAQAASTPERDAVIFQGQRCTFAELDRRASRLSGHLRTLGAKPGVTVGLASSRSIEMVVALLAILKSGAAYLPLDPDYPAERLRFMLEDSQAPLVVGDPDGATLVSGLDIRFVPVDRTTDWPESSAPASTPTAEHDLAYLIYTSGSTGRPKGVMVTHRNVVSFFAAMDDRIGGEPPGVWLAVTSLSFDISVLELLWTLARGFTVVVHEDDDTSARGAVGRPTVPGREARTLDFSLFYFASDEGQDPSDRYRLLMAGAKFADEHGFAAVWTPERHFHAFGGLYPSPSVISAAIAATTTRVQIRAGSVVLPLHHPARVAEEWAIVDNLSKGRVGVSFASGWQPDDFLLNPAAFADSKQLMIRHIDVVRRLWRGERVTFEGPRGAVQVSTLPRPVQPELPVWITSAGNPETFRAAGELGANVLTHLLGQTFAELEAKLNTYREAWVQSGRPGRGHVTLMLHTFVGESDEDVLSLVREPMKRYLASSISLIKSAASTFPVFQKHGPVSPADVDSLFARLEPEEMDALTEHAFNRYYETGGLFGTVDRCMGTIDTLERLGVDEVACLIDFGVESQAVIDHLPHLDALRVKASRRPRAAAEDHTIAAEIVSYGVTHMQCTPSLAAVLIGHAEARQALTRVRCLLVGGEALPPPLARDLCAAVGGRVMNMYGPTETTVWSTTFAVTSDDRSNLPRVTIGKPIANTTVYVLDQEGAIVPAGVPGELCIGGAGVTRGYFGQPGLTAARFVPHPFDDNGDRRVYRTGDLVRYAADGNLEYLGRLDHQVKVRGHRIELEEIEHAIREHDVVADVVVVAREAVAGDLRLVAYVVSREPSLGLDDVRQRLRTTLPIFMVPELIPIDALPRTPNGKIDRSALPAPELARGAIADSGRMAETDLEKAIAKAWCDVLHRPTVGVDENFFDLGGHSLLTLQVLERLRVQTGKSIAVTAMFQFPTVSAMAQHLRGDAVPAPALEQAKARALRRIARRAPQ